MFRDIIVRYTFFSFIHAAVQCALTRTPTSTTLVHESRLRLNCSTNLTGIPVAWRYRSDQSSTEEVIFTANTISVLYQNQFGIEGGTDQYDLIGKQLANNSFTYCGMYTCVDYNDGGAASNPANVSFGGRPNCTPNATSVLLNNQVEFTCGVPTCGTVSPQLFFVINGSAPIYKPGNPAQATERGSDIIGAEVNCTVSYGTLGNFTTTCPSITLLSGVTETTTATGSTVTTHPLLNSNNSTMQSPEHTTSTAVQLQSWTPAIVMATLLLLHLQTNLELQLVNDVVANP